MQELYCDFPINQALNPKALCFAFYYYFQKLFPEHFDELNLYDIYPFESYSPLMLACKFNHLEMMRYLLNSGVDVNLVVGYLYKDALTCAIISGSKEIVNTLLAHGARLNDKHISHVIALNNFELLQILIPNSAIVNESQIQEALNWGFNLQKFDEVINFY